ncbi:arylamine N-acetyltransferase [Actinoplanes sp. TFC3]|uniref:arylamine N-acetyltransferase family protein n=1 Tax=Actinoplanes sp. TFC3 TaxID=1710355 RepID=UPI00083599E0|nr:arylamine N-acetyltransferase [Actinoplanes sp. TFC3]
MTPIDVAAYLDRLGLPALPPSAENLAALYAAHVERIPFETLDQLPGVDPADAVRRIISTGRGGVCYHLNGALALLLDVLGYDVSLHPAGVQSRFAPLPQGPNGTHNVILVRHLPAAGNPEGRWLLDAGSGEGFHRPLPLTEGRYEQNGFHYGLHRTPGGWRLDYDRRESCRGLDFTERPAAPEEFALPYAEQAGTHMAIFFEYGWVKRHHAHGYDELIGCQLSHVSTGGRTSTTITEEQQWYAALAGVFGVRMPGLDAEARTALWERVRHAWHARDFATAIRPPRAEAVR